jgi:DNA-directed RNA polymerase specialized sigma24 family protein
VRLVRGEAHAEDAAQDTLVAALEHPPALDRDVRPWLGRVLTNFTRAWRRSEGRRRLRDGAMAGDAAEVSADPAAGRQSRRAWPCPLAWAAETDRAWIQRARAGLSSPGAPAKTGANLPSTPLAARKSHGAQSRKDPYS